MIELPLDSKIINIYLRTNKNKITQNVDSLIQKISKTLSKAPQETACFITDLQYAYSQLAIHADTARHYKMNPVSGDLTGTYRLKTRFHV